MDSFSYFSLKMGKSIKLRQFFYKLSMFKDMALYPHPIEILNSIRKPLKTEFNANVRLLVFDF